MRIVCILGTVGLLLGSLITFPGYLHWMLCIWLFVVVWLVVLNRPVWPWLLGLALIMLIRRPGFTLEFWTLELILLAGSVVDWKTGRSGERAVNSSQLLVCVALFAVGILGFGSLRWFGSHSSSMSKLDMRPIVCLGDSLTAFGYPQELEAVISVPVEDFGFSGIKTDDGIKMIPEILATNPQLVVLELGGHDYNSDKKSRSATRKNLVTLIESFLENDVQVILVEIPRGFISDPYDGLERELSAKYDLQLIDDSLIRSFVFNSPILPPGMWLEPSKRYSDDGLHPNELGNKIFAATVCDALVKIYGPSIVKGANQSPSPSDR